MDHSTPKDIDFAILILMKKGRLILILGLAVVAAVILSLLKYLAILPVLFKPVPLVAIQDQSPVEFKVESVAEGLFVPWSIVFTADDRMLVTERDGKVRAIQDGQLQANPLYTFSPISAQSEEGLMGMAMDPNYQTNKQLYFCLAYPKGQNLVDKVVRLTDEGSRLTNEVMVVDDIPAAKFHAGCRVKFGPDGKLYITTGDSTKRELAQDKNSLAGKILRLNADGSIPADNPFPNSPIYSLGHRNPQGLDWHPETQTLYETEHGPSGFDGPGGGDEVNVITKGGNYGWPTVSHEKSQTGLISPKLVFTPAVAPAAGHFYRGDVFPQFKHNFLFGTLQGQGIYRAVLDSNNSEIITGHEKIAGIDVGRVREVTEGPDGLIYFTTSNRDGRGSVKAGDDHIYRLVPR